MVAVVEIEASGSIRFDGRIVTPDSLREALSALRGARGFVQYRRAFDSLDVPEGTWQAAQDIIRLVSGTGLPVELRLPVYEVMARPALAFAEARYLAGRRAAGRGQIAIMTRGGILSTPCAPAVGFTEEHGRAGLDAILPWTRPLDITVVGRTDGIRDQSRVEDLATRIPFFGYLLGFCHVGHRVVIHDGTSGALAATVVDADALIVQAEIQGGLGPDWVSVADSYMGPGPILRFHAGGRIDHVPRSSAPEAVTTTPAVIRVGVSQAERIEIDGRPVNLSGLDGALARLPRVRPTVEFQFAGQPNAAAHDALALLIKHRVRIRLVPPAGPAGGRP